MANMDKEGGAAFPLLPPDGQAYEGWPAYPGMSLRDYFAGQYIVGRAARGTVDYVDAARCAYEVADEMLKARVSK